MIFSYLRKLVNTLLVLSLFLYSSFYTKKIRVHASDTSSFEISISYSHCYDTIDNDGDGKTDFPEDPDCTSETDDNESGNLEEDPTSVTFIGKAYPNSSVVILKDAQIVTSTVAGPDAKFKVTIIGVGAGNHVFSLYSEDKYGNRSSLYSFALSITFGATMSVSGIYIAPTIAVDKLSVKKGDNLALFGQSDPGSNITIEMHSEQEFFLTTTADQDGIYLYNFDTAPLELGEHMAKSKASKGNELSPYGRAVEFVITNTSDNSGGGGGQPTCRIADLNCDGRVNLVDFSIEAYWYRRASPPAEYDLNHDGKIDIVDFSIMAYYWTG